MPSKIRPTLNGHLAKSTLDVEKVVSGSRWKVVESDERDERFELTTRL